MPFFVIYGRDRRPDGPEIRAKTRSAHLEYIKSLGERVKLGGMMMEEDDATPAGSMIVVEADSLEDVQEIVENDPYSHAGLFESCEIKPYRWAINPPRTE